MFCRTHEPHRSILPSRIQRRERACKPIVDQLEGRRLLSAYPILTVNTTVDEKDGGTLVSPAGPDMKLSLREAITVANLDSGANTINFNIPTTDPNYNGQWWT